MKSCFSDLPVKDGKSGTWKLDTFEITTDKALTLALRAECTGNTDEFIPPGGSLYKILAGSDLHRGIGHHHIPAVGQAAISTGRVLINGLGLGMVLHAILQKDDVTHVTVIEKEQDVINLVAASFATDLRVEIINADAMEYCPPAGVTYNACWHDIWTDFATANLAQMDKLESKYRDICDWQGSWGREECEQKLIEFQNLEAD
ncbi:hypothetical protein PJ201_17580 [Escherichia coli]|uniref:hypothetical protein n=1 Tax=Escherichia coli TaxID=562 RepID=UPI002300E5AD|nr:hypothetical protein [Escherichia coli]MDA7316288.1 hypothetical protein [Escherichia coli]